MPQFYDLSKTILWKIFSNGLGDSEILARQKWSGIKLIHHGISESVREMLWMWMTYVADKN